MTSETITKINCQSDKISLLIKSTRVFFSWLSFVVESSCLKYFRKLLTGNHFGWVYICHLVKKSLASKSFCTPCSLWYPCHDQHPKLDCWKNTFCPPPLPHHPLLTWEACIYCILLYCSTKCCYWLLISWQCGHSLQPCETKLWRTVSQLWTGI